MSAPGRHWEQDKEATVYVGNLDERVTDRLVWELMLQVGRIQNVHLPKDRVTQTHQGYGFVEFQSEEEADYAAKIMNQIRLYGKPIRVNKASADKQKTVEVGAELFVGNLDPMVDEKVLFDCFSRFGSLVSAPKVARDENNLSKGYGFVSFATFESSDDAIANMNGQYLMNKEISVQYAYKKDGKALPLLCLTALARRRLLLPLVSSPRLPTTRVCPLRTSRPALQFRRTRFRPRLLVFPLARRRRRLATAALPVTRPRASRLRRLLLASSHLLVPRLRASPLRQTSLLDSRRRLVRVLLQACLQSCLLVSSSQDTAGVELGLLCHSQSNFQVPKSMVGDVQYPLAFSGIKKVQVGLSSFRERIGVWGSFLYIAYGHGCK
ncbi:hypothetical protein MPH_06834 [Macrophomina phaseolina MS6]|uniref:RRM domain-containing protein n=1 Tax=Macrophomina phaseolina (strain MS6) TaxID=1126212 RepID=K2S050_MACPH|nr:hypothetical protein MPH_06834 [Macrophomina phaseolina MS6]